MGLLSTFGAASGRAFGLTRVGAAIKDAYFNLVTLLLPGNGTNGAQNNTFLDSSTNNFTITRNGNTTQGTFSPFSQTGWSIYSDGGNNILTVSSTSPANFGSGAMTIEMWVYLTGTASNQYFASNYQNSTNGWGIGYSSSTGKFGVNLAGDGYSIVTDSTVSANRWYHLAVSGTKTSPGIKFFLDGVQQGSTFTGTVNFDSTNALVIGDGAGAASTQRLNGYLSNLRLVKGTALYTSNFTPPTAPLTAVTNTSLLTCQDNRFKDNSTNNYTFAVTGTPSVQAFSPFAPTAAYSASTVGGSGYFDGSGDYLTLPSSSNLAVGTGDFCIEGWVYFTGSPTSAMLITNISSNDTQLAFRIDASNYPKLQGWNTNFVVSNTTVGQNQWYHLVCCRVSNSTSIFINGTRTANDTVTNNFSSTNAFTVGGQSSDLPGYISGLRLIKGSSPYDPTQTTLTVPTAPLTAITNTQLLLNFTNAGITDATAKNDLETVGNAQISTTQSKFGGSSMYFDGTGDWLFSKGGNNRYDFGTGDFTMECWFYPTTTPSMAGLLATGNNTAWGCVWIYTTSTAVYLRATSSSSGQDVGITGGTFNTNAWNHVAAVRSGTTFSLYLNGSRVGTTTSSTALKTNCDLVVGAIYESSTPGSPFTGYIDDARISLYARYSGATYTQPAAAFPVQ